MTKPDFTSINVLIDRSGSMNPLTNDTIGGFNSFLQEQKDTPGEAVLTLCLFDSRHEIVHNCLPLNEVPPLTNKTYRAGGGTALLDALGATINTVGANLSNMAEEERPSKVIFLVITDGQENSSREFALEKIKDMVSHQRNVYSWEFVFMGANIDSISTGSSLGMSRSKSINYVASPVGTRNLYNSASASLRSYRSTGNYTADPQVNIVTPDDLPLVTPVVTGPVDFKTLDLTTKSSKSSK